MLTVRHLPPEPTWQDWVKDELPSIRGLGLWALALLCLAVLGHSESKADEYRLGTSDDVMVVTPVGNPSQCRAGLQPEGDTDDQACVSGLVSTAGLLG